MGYVRKGVLDDVLQLHHKIKQSDLDEIRASDNVDAFQALVLPFTKPNSDIYTMISDEEKIIGMFGVVASDAPDWGVAWMLTSEELFDEMHKPQFIKLCRKWVKELNKDYEFIFNWIDIRNYKSVKWLEFCGFKIMETRNYGHADLPFHLLMRRK